MKIYGLEKISMVDYDGLCACTLFTGVCPFRCPYCHNAGLVDGKGQVMDEQKIFDYLASRQGILDGVVISGGEPTVYDDLPQFIQRIRDMGYKVKLDTNGSNPEMLEYLVKEKLVDYVAMDIKNSLENYDIAVGIDHFDSDCIAQSVAILKRGEVDYEFRTTLVDELHSEYEFRKIAQLISGAPKYYLQKFVDSGNCIASGLHAVPKETAQKYLEIVAPYVGIVELRSY